MGWDQQEEGARIDQVRGVAGWVWGWDQQEEGARIDQVKGVAG